MEKRPVIMLNTSNAATFCRSRCANSECSRHISKLRDFKGMCTLTLLKGQSECEGFLSTRKKERLNNENTQ
jgi:hypothetical protein